MLLLGVACRSAAPPPASKTVNSGPAQLETPTGALEALDAAEAQLLDEVAFSVRSEATGTDDEDGSDGPRNTPSSPKSTGVSRQPRGRCSRACAALASMVRAADRLCQMTGEEEVRCRSARRRVEAGRRIVERHCPSCDA